MPAITLNQSRTFVNSVKLPRPPRRLNLLADTPPVELKSVDAQALVVGAGLIAAAEKVPPSLRKDLIDCTLFAQLTAIAAVPDRADSVAWYHAYFKTLTALGWSQSDTQFEEYRFSGKNAEAHRAILKVLTALLGPQAAALVVVKAAIEALQSMDENRPWLTLFERESRYARSAKFQVATAEATPDGVVQVALAAFSLQTRANVTQVLFFKFGSSSTHLEYAAGKATIYEAALAGVREKVAARLAAFQAAFVGEVALPPPPGSARPPRPAARPDAEPAPSRIVRALLS